jgi:TPR repeat protein
MFILGLFMRFRILFLSSLIGLGVGCTTLKPNASSASGEGSTSKALDPSDEKTSCETSYRELSKSKSKTTGAAQPAGKSGAPVDALYFCTKASEKGDAQAQFFLANMYESGNGVNKSLQEATRWYKESAKGGLAEAQFKIGLMYGKGEGVAQDKSEATFWYRKAAEQGHKEAQFTMGFRTEFGKGVQQNYKEAIAWYLKAAEQGHSSAQNYLGVMTSLGQGIPQNNIEAYKWFNLAAVSGNKEYIANRDRMAKKLGASQLAEGQKLASDWAKKHSSQK